MNLSFQDIIDPIIKIGSWIDTVIKFATWLFVFISWILLHNSELYEKLSALEKDFFIKSLNFIKSLILLGINFVNGFFLVFVSILLVLSIYFSWKGHSMALGSTFLFSTNITGTFIFGIFMFHDGVSLLQGDLKHLSGFLLFFIQLSNRCFDRTVNFRDLLKSQIKWDASVHGVIQATAIFMILAGIVSMVDVVYQACRRFSNFLDSIPSQNYPSYDTGVQSENEGEARRRSYDEEASNRSSLSVK